MEPVKIKEESKKNPEIKNTELLKKEYENLKLPSLVVNVLIYYYLNYLINTIFLNQKNRELLSNSRTKNHHDTNGYKRCPCLMHNRLYYQEQKLAYLETDFLSQDYWNDQYSLIFENMRHSSFNHNERFRSESLNRMKLLSKTPWDAAF